MLKRIKQSLGYVQSRVVASSDTITLWLLGVIVVLGPLFFLPVRNLSVPASKGLFFFVAAALALLLYGISMLRKGVISLPRGGVFIVLGLIVVTGFIGSLLSKGFKMSLFGYGFETTTWLFMVVFSLIAFLSYRMVTSYKRIGTLYGGMVTVFLLVALFHVVRFFAGPSFGNFGVLGTSTATILGSWTDLAIFFGFIVLFAVSTLELAGLKKSFKWVMGGVGIFAVLMLLFMNISIVWVVLGLVSLIFTLYLFSFAYWDTDTKTYRREHRTPWFVLALLVISILALLFGRSLNVFANKYQDISWNDVRPSVSMTARVTGKSLVHNFATGYGPNSFTQVWSLIKPAALSGQGVITTDFTQGVGFVPTQIATNGIVGAILWISLFVLILIALIRKTRQGFTHALDRYFSILMGMGILYLGILVWAYVPGVYALILFAVLIGAFLRLSSEKEVISERVFSFIKDPRASFFGIFAILVLMAGALVGGYIALRKTASFVHYAKGTMFLDRGDTQEANKEMSIAAVLADHDLYHQTLTNFALSDINQMARTLTDTNKQAVSKQLEQILGIALGHAQAAIKANPTSYKNWLLLGNVYQSMVTLGIEESYGRASDAYQEAQKRVPHDVTIKLAFAGLALANKDTPGAERLIKESINEFPTADAYILRAQIYLAEQKYNDAIDALDAAVGLDPYNPELAYQYGLLLFSQKSYTKAINSFQRVLLLDRSYALAYVYLGASFERTGDSANATKIYDFVRKQFQGGGEAIEKLRSGIVETPAPVTSDQTDKLPTKTKTPVAPTPKKQ